MQSFRTEQVELCGADFPDSPCEGVFERLVASADCGREGWCEAEREDDADCGRAFADEVCA